MTFFSELYGAYYNAVAAILKIAVSRPLNKDELRAVVAENAFGESLLNIEPALRENRWQLICPDGSTPILHEPSMPLTTIEKRWLKAIYSDPRIRLFVDDADIFPEEEPLFTEADYSVFDKYTDGDPYDDKSYVRTFRLALDAVKKQYPLSIDTTSRKGGVTHMIVMPKRLEYSEKDDKFRLIGSGIKYGGTINLARIINCSPYTGKFEARSAKRSPPETRAVEFELIDKRKTLERALMHFAHFRKQAERIDDDRYRVTVFYDKDDETEMVIRVLSFGPMVKVTSPEHFVNLVKTRLKSQKSCGH